MAVPTITFGVTFLTDFDGKKYLVVTGTTDYVSYGIALADVVEAVSVTSPSGLAFKVADLDFPDIDVDATREYRIEIPKDAKKDYQEGEYTVSMIARVTGLVDPADYESEDVTATYCDDIPDLCLQDVTNCTYLVLEVTDKTKWSAAGYTVTSRSWRLRYPAGSDHADITSSSISVSTSGQALYSGDYSVSLDVVATNGTNTVSIRKAMKVSVDCPDLGLCNLLCCLNTTYRQMTGSSNSGLKIDAENRFRKMVGIMMMIDAAMKCDNKDLMAQLKEDFYRIGNCNEDCGCGCSDDDCDEGPRLLTPVFTGGGGGGISYTFLAGTGLVVTVDGTSVTYELDKDTQALLAAITSTSVVSTDGSITVTASTVAGTPPTRRFDLSVSNKAPDSIRFRITMDPSTGLSSMSTPVINGSTFVAPTVTATGGAFYLLSSFWAGGVTPSLTTVSVDDVLVTLRQPYSNTIRYSRLIDVIGRVSTASPYNVIIGLNVADSSIGGQLGWSYLATWYNTYCSQIAFDVEIRKLTS